MDQAECFRELLTIEEYITLSAKINYQLSAQPLNKTILLALVLGPAEFDEHERDVLLEAFNVLQAGYQQERRRLGTPGILHPLRTAAILARSIPKPTLMHMLGALLHDKDEDLTEAELGSERWQLMEQHFALLLAKLDPDEQSLLHNRIRLLSHKTGTYEDYLMQVLDMSRKMPDLLHVKLADRIDNTFDIHLQHPGITNFNFYRAVFDILFLPRFSGVRMGKFHFMPDEKEGVMLLSQLFKNTIFLALLRHHGLDALDATTQKLFIGLAVAGIREAQWLMLEMFNTCLTDVSKQRALLREVMDYCAGGGIDVVTSQEKGSKLDGMLLSTFRAEQAGERRANLIALFADHELLGKMVLAFITIYACFINDPSYTINGIDRDGVCPPG